MIVQPKALANGTHPIRRVILYAIGLLFVILLVIYFLPSLLLAEPSSKDLFFQRVALDFRVPEICEKISSRAALVTGPSCDWFCDMTPRQYDYLRSICYENVARKTKDVSLCKKVQPLSVHFVAGNCSETDCTANLTTYSGSLCGGIYSQSIPGIVQFMQELGYAPSDIPAYDAFHNTWGDDAIYRSFYNDILIGDKERGANRDDFIQRVRAMK